MSDMELRIHLGSSLGQDFPERGDFITRRSKELVSILRSVFCSYRKLFWIRFETRGGPKGAAKFHHRSMSDSRRGHRSTDNFYYIYNTNSTGSNNGFSICLCKSCSVKREFVHPFVQGENMISTFIRKNCLPGWQAATDG